MRNLTLIIVKTAYLDYLPTYMKIPLAFQSSLARGILGFEKIQSFLIFLISKT